MKFNGRSIPACANNALIRTQNSRWAIVALIFLLSWLCTPLEIQAATRDRKKPSVPTALSATPANCSRIELSWTASTDTGGSGLMAYKIYRNGVLLKQVLAPATQASDAGLAANTTYSYAILAIDKAGNKSAKSAAVSATTPACCGYSISPTGALIGAEGSSGNTTVTTGTGCSWSATSSASWLSAGPNAAGTGTGSFGWTAAANTSTNARTGVITVGGQTFTVTQEGAGPTLIGLPLGEALDNTVLNWTSGGHANWVGQSTISYNGDAAQAGLITNSQNSWFETTVTGPVDLAFIWKVSSEQNYDFIRFSVDGVDQSSASGEVNWQQKTFSIPLGTHTLRWTYAKDNIISAGMDCAWVDAIQVTTQPVPCSYSVTLANASFTASGGSASASVTTANGCGWTASTAYGWIHTASSGSGSGTATFTVDSNPSTDARVGTLTIAGQTFTVTQEGATLPCSYSLSAAGANPNASANSGTVTVTTGASCNWTTISSAPSWLTCSPTSGTGSRTVTWTVAANISTSPRTGTLTIAGQTFTVTQAGAMPCTYSLSASGANATASANSGTVTVTAGSACSWTTTSGAPNWLTCSPASGSGSQTVTWTATANTSTSPRTGTLTVAGQTFTVTQDGVPCTYSLSAISANPNASAGSGTVTVTAGSTCNWTTTSGAPSWLTCSPASGTGSQGVTWTVTANISTSPRTGTLTIAGQTFTVTQDGATPCTYSLSAAGASPNAAANSGTVTLTAGAPCSWTASSSAPGWLTFTPSGGAGSATITWSVTPNNSCSPRSGTLTIAGQPFQVNQAAGSGNYSISPTSTPMAASGGSGSVNVTANSGCGWIATANDSWISITAGNAGSGNGVVSYLVQANPTTTPRNGSLNIAGQTFSVSQSGAACTYGLSQGGANPGSAASSGTFNVTAGAGCAWTPSSSAPTWLTFSPPNGVGNGTVSWFVTANTSTSSRSGTLNIAGQTFLVSQSGASCTYSLSSSSANPGSLAGSGTFNVNAGAGCSWSVSSSDSSWLTFAPSSGAGSAAVTWYVTANTSTSPRSGTLSIAGQAFSVLQAGSSTAVAGGVLQWVKTAQGTDFFDNAGATAVASDRSGNLVSVGSFQGTVDFGNGPRTASTSTSDGFVTKYNTQGGLSWVKQIGGSGNDSVDGVAIDRQDNIIVLGSFRGSVDLGGGPLISAGVSDLFIAKFSPSGVHMWSKRFGGPWDDLATGLTIDANDNIFLSARFQSVNAFFGNDSTGNPVLLSNGSQYYDIALAKLSSAGTTLWAKKWGGADEDVPFSIAVDRSGDLWVAGRFTATTDLGGGTRTSTGSEDGFIAKYAGATGNRLWDRKLGSGRAATCRGITTDPNTGNVIVTGTFMGTTDFGGGAVASGTGSTMFLAGYDSAGNYLWARTWGGELMSSGDSGCAVKVDTDGVLILTANYNSVWMPDPTIGGQGYFVSGFSLSGNSEPVYRWCKRSGTLNYSSPCSIAFDAQGYAITAGYFNYTTDFGGTTLVAPGGTTGAFVAKYTK